MVLSFVTLKPAWFEFRESLTEIMANIRGGLRAWNRKLKKKDRKLKLDLPGWFPNGLCVAESRTIIGGQEAPEEHYDKHLKDLNCIYFHGVYKWIPKACDEVLEILRALQPQENVTQTLKWMLDQEASLHVLQGLFFCYLWERAEEIRKGFLRRMFPGGWTKEGARKSIQREIDRYEARYSQDKITTAERNRNVRALSENLKHLENMSWPSFGKRSGPPSSQGRNLFVYLAYEHLRKQSIEHADNAWQKLANLVSILNPSKPLSSKDTFMKCRRRGWEEFKRRRECGTKLTIFDKLPIGDQGISEVGDVAPGARLGLWSYWVAVALSYRGDLSCKENTRAFLETKKSLEGRGDITL